MSLFNGNNNVFELTPYDFANSINHSNFSIPAFQRKYQWGEKAKIKNVYALLDSIHRGQNIGSIVFWNSTFLGLSRKIDNFDWKSENGIVCYVVDGQQRSITMSALFAKEEVVPIELQNIYIRYHKKDGKLTFEGQKDEKQSEFYITYKHFKINMLDNANGDYSVVDDKKNHDTSSEDFEHLEKFQIQLDQLLYNIKNLKLVIGYKVQIPPDDLDLAISQFEKINVAGVKLTAFQILAAIAYSDNEYSISSKTIEFTGTEFAKSDILVKNNKEIEFSTEIEKIIINSFKLIKNYESSNEPSGKISMNSDAITDFDCGDSKILDRILCGIKVLFAAIKKMGLNSIKDLPYTHNAVAFIFLRDKYKIDIPDHKLLIKLSVISGLFQLYEKSASQSLVNNLMKIEECVNNGENIKFWNKHLDLNQTDIVKSNFDDDNSFNKAIRIILLNDERIMRISTKNEKFEKRQIIKIVDSYPNKKELVKSIANFVVVDEEDLMFMKNGNQINFFSGIDYRDAEEKYDSQSFDSPTQNQLVSGGKMFQSFITSRSKLFASYLNNYVRQINNE